MLVQKSLIKRDTDTSNTGVRNHLGVWPDTRGLRLMSDDFCSTGQHTPDEERRPDILLLRPLCGARYCGIMAIVEEYSVDGESLALFF